MKEEIIKLLDDKVNEVFLEMQARLNIKNGDITPLQQIQLDYYVCSLASIIENILRMEE